MINSLESISEQWPSRRQKFDEQLQPFEEEFASSTAFWTDSNYSTHVSTIFQSWDVMNSFEYY
jgi:hypothetical protein